jgi:diguanylate cyclase (GGDEF)-like protein/PAS domain S-box-containing protein
MLDLCLSPNDIIYVLLLPTILIFIIYILYLKIRKLNQTIATFTDSIPDIVWKVDKNYKIIFVNSSDEKIRGFKSNEVIGSSIFKHITKDSQSVIGMLKEIRLDEEKRNKQAKTRTTELELLRKNKPPITMEIVVSYEYKNGKVVSFSGVARDITVRKLNEEELYFEANHDSLTKLYNRRRFMDIAKREFDLAKRYSKPLSVIMFDIDFFKKVNDTYGHHAGDVVLQKVAEIGIQNLRATDVFGRLGGEEFAILATETDIEGAVNLAEKIRKTYEKQIVNVDGNNIRFTVSMGIATLSSQDSSFDVILQRADNMLYKAKNSGRNNTKFY